jgi:hypothetical protein
MEKKRRKNAVHAQNADATLGVSVCGFSNVVTTAIDAAGSVNCGYCLGYIYTTGPRWYHTNAGWSKSPEREVSSITTTELIKQLKLADEDGTAQVFLYTQSERYGVSVVRSEDGCVYLMEL